MSLNTHYLPESAPLPSPGKGDREIHTSSSLTNSYQSFHHFPTLCLLLRRSLTVWECFCKCWRRAMEVFVAACMLWVIQVTFSWPRCPTATEYLWDHQTLVWLITWHLSSCFISVNGLFPLSAPAAQRKKPEGYWLLFTNQPHIFFSPCTQSLVRFFSFF